jgi:hypothetical protein
VVHAQNVEMGLGSPLPFWLEYLVAAQELSVPPWELFDDPEDTGWTSRDFWRECALIYANARADYEKATHAGQNGSQGPVGGPVGRG